MKKDGIYFAYLRKSREDRDAELHGQGDTLQRHESILKNLEQYYGITISKWYKEVVSGETIAARPEMMQMLNDIEEIQPDGVLVVEIERLARGDTRDQGLIMETFKYANTLIITPTKVYDTSDEFDEEYAEFGLFMSRREYKTINRRLQRGRKQSQNEGKWIANIAPYGYERIKIPNDKGFTLQIIPEKAQVVKLIYRMFVQGTPETDNVPVGTSKICRVLDQLQIPSPSGGSWPPCTIRSILENPAYIGKIRAGMRKQEKTIIGGTVTISRPVNKDVTIYDGLHPAIIDDSIFQLAQEKRRTSYRKPFFEGIKNPLAGLIYCSECGKSMYRRPAGNRCPADAICCNTHGCPTSASYYYLIEERLLQCMEQWLADYKIELGKTSDKDYASQLEFERSQFESANNDLLMAQNQLNKAMDMLEKGVYTVEIFQQRATELNARIALSKKSIHELSERIKELKLASSNREDIIPRFEKVLSLYPVVETGEAKNALLKEILNRVEYSKPHKGNRKTGGMDAFELKIFPKL